MLRKTLQDEMDKGAQVFRTHESLAHVMDVIADLRERYKNIHVDDKGKRFNTDLLEAVELGFLLDLAEVVVYSAQNREESRGGHMRDDFPTRDDENYMQHTMAYLSGDPHSSHPADHIELGWKPVVSPRTRPGSCATRRWRGSTEMASTVIEQVDTSDEVAETPEDTGIQSFLVTFNIRRFDPEVDDEPRWVDYDVELYSTDRVLDALHKIKWEVDGSLSFRRSLRARHLRIGCHAHQRPQPPRLQDADQGSRHLAADLRRGHQGLPLEKDLIVDMEPFFASYREVQPFLISNSKPEPARSACSRSSTARSSTTPPSASCAPRAPRRAPCSGPTVSTSAPPRSSTRTASSSTRATTRAMCASTSSTTKRACGAAAPPSQLHRGVPPRIEVTKAIAEVKQAVLRGGR